MGIMEKFDLYGRVSIITGGERGIGLAIGIGLAQAGSHIVIAGQDKDSAEKAIPMIEAEGVRCVFIETDVTSEQQVMTMVSEVQATFGHIDILVNNAGVNRNNPVTEMPVDDWDFVVKVNMTGPFIVSKHVGKVMREQKRGSVVNIASMSGLIVNDPQPQCAYNSSKAGLIMLTKSMACEWAKDSVRVNAIAPGYMRTALTAHRFQDPENPLVKRWLSMVPMGRVGVPDELVGLALYLASDASTYTTGSIITVDGGYTAW